MEIYLQKKGDWKFFDVKRDSQELKDRKIVIGNYAELARDNRAEGGE